MEEISKSKDPGKRHGKLFFINWPLILLTIALLAYGVLVVYSATTGVSGDAGMFKRQLLGIGIGLIFMGAAWRIDYRLFKNWILPLFIVATLLILSPRIPGLGVSHKGATSWIQLPIIGQIQPSEPAKLVVIVLFAAIVAQYKGTITSFKDFAKVSVLLLIPFFLILMQPDLGSGLVLLVIAGAILLVGGLSYKWLITGVVAMALVAGLAFAVDPLLDKAAGHDVFLKTYQKNRLFVFMNPDLDPTGAGHNLKQSKIAIGSGELTGKGLSGGTQGSLHFLPEAETDFIFAVLAEELGFIGVIVLLALYLALLVVSLDIASRSSDLFGTLIVAGIIAMWTFQILENVGMTLGLMPITGIPLPFMSYGASFLVTNLGAVGLLLSVWTRRQGV